MVGGTAPRPLPGSAHPHRGGQGKLCPVQPLPPDGGSDPGPLPSERPLDRRQFLQLSALGAAGFVGATRLQGKHHKQRVPAKAKRGAARQVAVVDKQLPSGVTVPTAPWLIAETQAGHLELDLQPQPARARVRGLCQPGQCGPGDDVAVFVSTTGRAVQVQAYRMGLPPGPRWPAHRPDRLRPGGGPGRARRLAGHRYGDLSVVPTLTLNITKDWPPGCYLLKLSATAAKSSSFRSPSATTPPWRRTCCRTGSRSGRPTTSGAATASTAAGQQRAEPFADRSRTVSFDRPYRRPGRRARPISSGTSSPAFQSPAHGPDLTYWTDVDLHVRPELLAPHRRLVSLGHDEHWSMPMRRARPRPMGGLNLAFPGANAVTATSACSHLGRQSPPVCYKDAAEDPISQQ